MHEYVASSESSCMYEIVARRHKLNEVLFWRVRSADQEVFLILKSSLVLRRTSYSSLQSYLEHFPRIIVDRQNVGDFVDVQLFYVLGIAEVAHIKSGQNLKSWIIEKRRKNWANEGCQVLRFPWA